VIIQPNLFSKLGYDFSYFFPASNNDGSTSENEEKKKFNSFYELFLDYTEFSTIQGLKYIFVSYQTIIGKLFWSMVVLLMLLLGLYWCNQSYQGWKDNPVQTMVTTTSFSINEVKKIFSGRFAL